MAVESHPVILVIDDEIGPRESLRMLFKNDYEVVCASSVDEGISELRARRPDLIIMDIRMPGKSGIDGLKEVRAVDDQVSVVMLTGYGALETAQQALRLGANDYINKPFDTKDMQKIVERYVQRSRLERRRGRMLQDLKEMNAKLVTDLANKEHMASLGQTSVELMHDLRNPLTVVSGYMDLLMHEIQKTVQMNGQAADYLDVIEQNVRRCVELSHMWQNVRHAKDTAFGKTSLSQVLDDVRALCQPLALSESVDIAFSIDVGDTPIHGIGPQLVRAIHNLISNAIHASSPDGRAVDVQGRIVGDNVEIVVRDYGCGMSADVLARVFEPYFSTRKEQDGTGLGMHITRKIIEEHKGTIDVQSEPDKGTTVTVRLPTMKD
jgi:signal transduction histidine kinase